MKIHKRVHSSLGDAETSSVRLPRETAYRLDGCNEGQSFFLSILLEEPKSLLVQHEADACH